MSDHETTATERERNTDSESETTGVDPHAQGRDARERRIADAVEALSHASFART